MYCMRHIGLIVITPNGVDFSSSCMQQIAILHDSQLTAVFPCTGEVKVGIFALNDIPVGEELSYDYQFQHYGLAQAAGAYRQVLTPTARMHFDIQANMQMHEL